MPTSSLWQHVDQLWGGTLEARLRDLRAQGASLDEIDREIGRPHEVYVSRQTIANWCAALDIGRPT